MDSQVEIGNITKKKIVRRMKIKNNTARRSMTVRLMEIKNNTGRRTSQRIGATDIRYRKRGEKKSTAHWTTVKNSVARGIHSSRCVLKE